MFAFKAHNPYEQSLALGNDTEVIRQKIDEVVADWTTALDLCNLLDEKWKVNKVQIKEDHVISNSSWWQQTKVLIKGQPTLEGYELYEKHAGEFRSKIQTLKEISRSIFASLSHIEGNANGNISDQKEEMKVGWGQLDNVSPKTDSTKIQLVGVSDSMEESKQEEVDQQSVPVWTSSKKIYLLDNAEQNKYVQVDELKSDWSLDMPGYQPKREKDFLQALITGEKFINISATCMVLNAICRVLKQVVSSLNEMVSTGKNLSYSLVRKFVVNFYNLEMIDLILVTAMKAPTDDLWFQSRQSEDWALLDSNTTKHEIQNATKYIKQFRSHMDTMLAAGAAHMITHQQNNNKDVVLRSALTLYYRLMKQDGSLQFRYLVATQRHHYDHMLSFYNIMSTDKNIMRGNEIACDRIKTNQIFFVPMLAKRLTL